MPALTPATCLFHQAAEVNINPMDFIDMIVQFGLEEHANQINESAKVSNYKSAIIMPMTTKDAKSQPEFNITS